MSSSAGKCCADALSNDASPSDTEGSDADAPASAKRARVGDAIAPAPEVAVEVAVDEPVAAVAQVAQAALTNAQVWLTAAQKRAKFLAKYDGLTPVEILGTLSVS